MQPNNHTEPDPPLTPTEITRWLEAMGSTDEARLTTIQDLIAPHGDGNKRDPMLKSDKMICANAIQTLKERIAMQAIQMLQQAEIDVTDFPPTESVTALVCRGGFPTNEEDDDDEYCG